MNKIIENLNWRYAAKSFDSTKSVSEEDLQTIFEAFRLTASSFGLQPWKLFAVKSQDLKEQLLPHSWNQKQVVQAPYVLVFARNDNTAEQVINEGLDNIVDVKWITRQDLQGLEDVMKNFTWSMWGEDNVKNWYTRQVYIALGNILNVLAELKIDSCAMEWIIPEKYDEVLGLKEKWYASIFALPIGYRNEDDKYSSAEKVRFPLEKVTEIL